MSKLDTYNPKELHKLTIESIKDIVQCNEIYPNIDFRKLICDPLPDTFDKELVKTSKIYKVLITTFYGVCYEYRYGGKGILYFIDNAHHDIWFSEQSTNDNEQSTNDVKQSANEKYYVAYTDEHINNNKTLHFYYTMHNFLHRPYIGSKLQGQSP